jgi:hypothetical protein
MPEKYKNWEVDYYLKNDMGDLYVGKAKIFLHVLGFMENQNPKYFAGLGDLYVVKAKIFYFFCY